MELTSPDPTDPRPVSAVPILRHLDLGTTASPDKSALQAVMFKGNLFR